MEDKKVFLLAIGILIMGLLLGAVGMYAFSVYAVFNSLASMEEAPFMQGFMMGFGSGSALMYEYYVVPNFESPEEFAKLYDAERVQSDMNHAIYNTQTGKYILSEIQKYSGDEIVDWIHRTEERSRLGIFGFTLSVQKQEIQ